MRVGVFAAVFAAGLLSPVQAQDVHAVQGLFCNTRDQIDSALGHMVAGLDPRQAAELENVESVVCVYADKVTYLVTTPFIVGERFVHDPVAVYEAILVGVLVGDQVRSVAPPVTIFFVTDRRLHGAVSKGKV
jgi:hypothetical protein